MQEGLGGLPTGDYPNAMQFADAEAFLHQYADTPAPRRTRLAQSAPLTALKRTAVTHPDPFVRRASLSFLDHHANDQSTAVFVAALDDRTEFVRNLALHSLACETCKTDDLCALDVVPHLVDVLSHDPSAEMRHKAISLLLRLEDRDPSVRQAVQHAATHDPDDLVREAATTGLDGSFLASRKRYERRARRATRRRAADLT